MYQYQFRTTRGHRQPTVVKYLLIANIAGFLLHHFLLGPVWAQRALAAQGRYLDMFALHFGLIPARAFDLAYAWQWLTHMFLHGGLWHIFFNMFALYVFGPHVERELGKTRFLVLYFLAGIGAGLLQVAFNPASIRVMIGASGAIFGVAAAFAYLYPNSMLFVFGIIPVRAWKLLIGLAAISFLFSFDTSTSIGHAAHLGGIVAGFVFMEALFRRYLLQRKARRRSTAQQKQQETRETTRPQNDAWGRVVELERDEDGWWS